MKNYDIVSQEGINNATLTRDPRVIKLKEASYNNVVHKRMAAKNAQVQEEIKEAAVGPKFKVVEVVLTSELTEGVTPKKIKLNNATFSKVAAKGKVQVGVVKIEEPVVPSMPVEEKASVEEEKPVEVKTEEVPLPNFDLNFDFKSITAEPTPEPEDEKVGSISDSFKVPGYEEEQEAKIEEKTSVEEVKPVVEEKQEEVKAETPVEEEPVAEKEPEVKEEEPVSVEEVKPVVEEKEEEVKAEEPVKEEKQEKDKEVELNAQNLRDALKAKIKAVQNENKEELDAEKKARKEVEKELEAAKKKAEENERMLDETRADLAKLQEEVKKAKAEVADAQKVVSMNEKKLAAYEEVFAEIVNTNEETNTMKRAA